MTPAAPPRTPSYGPRSLLGSVLAYAACAAPFALSVRETGWSLLLPVVVAALAVVLVCVPPARPLGVGLLIGVLALALTALALFVLFLVALSASGPPVPPPPG